jgi:hypothetical protein
MKKVFVYISIALLVIPFLAISGEAYTLSFEGKASVAGYRDAGSPSLSIIKDCNISLNFTKWIIFKFASFCWFSLRSGGLSIYNSESSYNYTDGTIRGFLFLPVGIWTVGE